MTTTQRIKVQLISLICVLLSLELLYQTTFRTWIKTASLSKEVLALAAYLYTRMLIQDIFLSLLLFLLIVNLLLCWQALRTIWNILHKTSQESTLTTQKQNSALKIFLKVFVLTYPPILSLLLILKVVFALIR